MTDSIQPTNFPTFSDSKSIEEFLHKPFPTIAAAVTGVLASGKAEYIGAAGRILQAAFIGKTYHQLGREIDEFVKKGKLKPDYAEASVGFKSLLDVIQFIDAECPDEDRLRAAQAMFFAVNSVKTEDHQRLLYYELLQLSKRLSGSQIRLLAVVHANINNLQALATTATGTINIKAWESTIARLMGHSISSLVELDEGLLVQNKLIAERHFASDPNSALANGRLTDLGLQFCLAMKNYDEVKKELGKDKA